MASIYLRRSNWWIQFYHPHTRALIRESLGTTDPARAKLLQERIEHEVALLDLRFQAVEIPPAVAEILDTNHPAPPAEVGGNLSSQFRKAATAQESRARTTVEAALKAYLDFVRIENAPHHVANKLSMLKRFFGARCVARAAGGQTLPVIAHSDTPPPFFTGRHVDEIKPALVQNFIEQLPVATKTKRHYREVLHHFFAFCLKFDLFEPSNWHRPNPVGALPSYVCRNRRITFLSPQDVEEQLRALEDFPDLRVAVAIMIYAGLRRAETLWLTANALSSDLSYLSVLNCKDEDNDTESALKTGERSVTILPQLRAFLAEHLEKRKGRWMVSNSRGRRWTGDAFARALAKINKTRGLNWTCLHYRHTYATQRAAEGWPLFRIAKEMGNSVAVVEQYYAGFIAPSRSSPT